MGERTILVEEQETVINFQRVGNNASIWTSDSTMITKIDKLCEKSPEFYKVQSVDIVDGKVLAKEYLITDKNLISFRSGHAKRELTEEQRKELAERARARFSK